MYKKDIDRTIPIEGKRLTRKYDYTIKNASYTPTKKRQPCSLLLCFPYGSQFWAFVYIHRRRCICHSEIEREF